ncbi:MAG: putative toxin-antitoxin system toxin component, PIN family [Bacteroidetes bacterium]|nr:MAG: putative toxin-antitoxin system toxin component, PIN family [Bacteroidota bacterium]
MPAARRPKFRRFFSAADIEEILETIDEYADVVKVQSKINVCRDPKDNFLLSLSIDGNAVLLLTGDKNLLNMTKFGEAAIITISDFLQDK